MATGTPNIIIFMCNMRQYVSSTESDTSRDNLISDHSLVYNRIKCVTSLSWHLSGALVYLHDTGDCLPVVLWKVQVGADTVASCNL